MHPNYSEFLKFLLESEYHKYGNLTQCEYRKRTENTVDMGQKQNINEYSTEEILSDFLNNF